MAQTGIQPEVRDNFALMSLAAKGDIELSILPATVNRAATAAAWTRYVNIRLQTAAGDVHKWFTGSISTTLSIADTSTAGTASIPSTTLSFENGEARIPVSGDAAAWLATETDTLTIGNLTIYGETITGGTSVQTFV